MWLFYILLTYFKLLFSEFVTTLPFIIKGELLSFNIIYYHMKAEDISRKLIEKELKVTPQRMAIYEAIVALNNHPTAENIIEYIRKNHPNVSVGTVYKVLDVFAENALIKK
jgi:hypothetical protein